MAKRATARGTTSTSTVGSAPKTHHGIGMAGERHGFNALAQRRDGGIGVAQKQRAEFGQRQLAPRAIEQGDAENVFKLGQRFGDGRLGQAQGLGGGHDAAMPVGFDKAGEMAKLYARVEGGHTIHSVWLYIAPYLSFYRASLPVFIAPSVIELFSGWRPMSKIMPLEQAVRENLKDGDTVAFEVLRI